jgi:hypothetical protein
MPVPIDWYPAPLLHLHPLISIHPLVQVQSSVLLMSGYAVGKRFYKASNAIDGLDHLTAVPCGVCPVVSRVREMLDRWIDRYIDSMDGFIDSMDSMDDCMHIHLH